MFRLFKGSFKNILINNNEDVECLKQRLDNFFTKVKHKTLFFIYFMNLLNILFIIFSI